MNTACHEPHPDPDNTWTCSLPASHDGEHRAHESHQVDRIVMARWNTGEGV